MDKKRGIVVETQRPKPLSTLITAPKRKLDQDKYGDTTVTAPGTTSPAPIDAASSLEPITDDTVGSGQTIYERLTLTSGQYCPTLPPSFYRRVWYDGLEAFEDMHFNVDLATGCVAPRSTLPTTTVVTASYVKA